jgi:hypothetical protein
MAGFEAVRAFLQGVDTFRRQREARLSGSPFVYRLEYLGGHPGIWQQEPLWAGLLADRLRLVDQRGERCYDLLLDRICGVEWDGSGGLNVTFEPTAGLVATVAFAAEAEVGERLLESVALGAV